MILLFTVVQLTSLLLVGILFFLGFRIIEMNWSYRISKPWRWEQDIRERSLPVSLIKMERGFRDKVRFYTFWLQVKRLARERIPGAFAEVGVYKGEMARIIHAMDNSRTFYLFDTFEGFSARDLADENLSAENSEVDFSNTSEEAVREYLRGNENIVLKKGYFPDTAMGIGDKFALVSIDADLYQPTLTALDFFYPRLSAGGVIIVHDYNHSWQGIKKAVDEFMKSVPENLMEVADWQGSVMIIRNQKI